MLSFHVEPGTRGLRRRALWRRLTAGSLLAAALSAVSLAGGALLGGCGDESTPGKRVTLQTEVTAGADAAAPFTNAYGWTFTLKAAAISIGPLYYFDGAPLFSTSARPQDPATRVAKWLGIGVAHAHPGHYDQGASKGQALEPSSADLLAGPTALPAGSGISGVFRSARFSFHSPPVGPAAGALGDSVVVLEAEATKGDMTKLFRASAAFTDVLDSYGEPKVEGCELKEVDVQADGTITIEIKPTVWLDQMELDHVPDSEDGLPVDLEAGTPAHKAFTRGLKRGSAYEFTYSP
jgi:hypothetical protein